MVHCYGVFSLMGSWALPYLPGLGWKLWVLGSFIVIHVSRRSSGILALKALGNSCAASVSGQSAGSRSWGYSLGHLVQELIILQGHLASEL